jgi:hypothetical protein
VRRNPSTVVVLAGEVPSATLAAIGRSMNVTLVNTEGDGLDSAADALRRAAGITSPYVLVNADPLAAVAAAWAAMWDVRRDTTDTSDFELRAGEVVGAWRAGRFELPDYYLHISPNSPNDVADGPPDFYLGPLRSARPNRVAVAVAGSPEARAAEVLRALGSLRHGPWWPPLDEIMATARTFYPATL